MPLPTHLLTDALVDDVLIETFAFLAQSSRQSFHDVLGVSHVCRHWRRLALSSPELWRRFAFVTRNCDDLSYPSFTAQDESFMDTILGRCGELTLDVGCDSEPDRRRPVEIIRRELAVKGRLRRYRLPLISGNSHWWDLLTASDAPPIESESRPTIHGTLPFGALEDLCPESPGFWLNYVPLDKVKWLFGGELCVPRLRKLVVTNLSADVHRLSVPKLEELDLAIDPFLPPEPVWAHTPSSPCIFQLLNPHRGLRKLRIHEGHPVKTHPRPGFELQLPHLVELSLTMDFTCVFLLLSHLSLPKCRTIEIKFLTRDPLAGAEVLRDMVMRATGRIMERVVHPLLSQQQQDESSATTLSLIRCESKVVEYVFSPRLHDAPHWARDLSSDDVTIVIGFYWTAGKALVQWVLDGWVSAPSSVNVACLDLPDNAQVAEQYGEIIGEFVRSPSVGVKRVICSSDWERNFAEGMGESRIRAMDPPLEIINVAGSGRDDLAGP